MLQILSFICLWYGLKSLFSCLLQDHPAVVKIAGNITSMINGTILIIAPILIFIMEEKFQYGRETVQLILSINIAYNIVDFMIMTMVFKLHHIGVIICDWLIFFQPEFQIQMMYMIIFSLIELSNYYIWKYYHKIHYKKFKPSNTDIKIQLIWFVFFRIIAVILGLVLSLSNQLYYELTAFILVIIGSFIWGYGMYKKIKND